MTSTIPPFDYFSSGASWAPASGEALLYTVSIRSIFDSYTAAALARRAALVVGLDPVGMGSVAIVAGELSTNIVRHARAGKLTFYGSTTYLKLVAEDRGPGIFDVEAAMADGHSGGRTLGPDDPLRGGIGCGLGAVQRLSDRLQIRSKPGEGTSIVAVRLRARLRHA